MLKSGDIPPKPEDLEGRLSKDMILSMRLSGTGGVRPRRRENHFRQRDQV